MLHLKEQRALNDGLQWQANRAFTSNKMIAKRFRVHVDVQISPHND